MYPQKPLLCYMRLFVISGAATAAAVASHLPTENQYTIIPRSKHVRNDWVSTI